jgi:hypothetical protein
MSDLVTAEIAHVVGDRFCVLSCPGPYECFGDNSHARVFARPLIAFAPKRSSATGCSSRVGPWPKRSCDVGWRDAESGRQAIGRARDLKEPGWACERTATRLLDPPRSPRSGSDTTSAPTARRNRDYSRAPTRTCRRARGTHRANIQRGACRDCRSRRSRVKDWPNPPDLHHRCVAKGVAGWDAELAIAFLASARPVGSVATAS